MKLRDLNCGKYADPEPTFAERLALVNEHRAALGRPVFGPDLSLADLLKHEARIAAHASFGQDPWADTDGVDNAAPPA